MIHLETVVKRMLSCQVACKDYFLYHKCIIKFEYHPLKMTASVSQMSILFFFLLKIVWRIMSKSAMTNNHSYKLPPNCPHKPKLEFNLVTVHNKFVIQLQLGQHFIYCFKGGKGPVMRQVILSQYLITTKPFLLVWLCNNNIFSCYMIVQR